MGVLPRLRGLTTPHRPTVPREVRVGDRGGLRFPTFGHKRRVRQSPPPTVRLPVQAGTEVEGTSHTVRLDAEGDTGSPVTALAELEGVPGHEEGPGPHRRTPPALVGVF